jgi:hypothetical protein
VNVVSWAGVHENSRGALVQLIALTSAESGGNLGSGSGSGRPE